MTLILNLCDQIATRLNEQSQAGEFGMRFEAVRHFQPRFTLPELEASTKVCIVPTEVERNDFTRAMTEQISTIQVGVLAKVEPSNRSIDPLVKLVDDIAFDLDSWQIDERSSVTNASIAPIFDQELLKNNSQFTSIITLTIRSFFE